jgi:hypothetical protein
MGPRPSSGHEGFRESKAIGAPLVGRVKALAHDWQRGLYRSGKPSPVAKALNLVFARLLSKGLGGHKYATLKVVGRHTGKEISLPIVICKRDEGRYIVSMLGTDANWVKNVRAASGRAVLEHRTGEDIRLMEVPVQERAPIIRDYLVVAPGARAHFRVDRRSPLEEFERIAGDYPVFKIESAID